MSFGSGARSSATEVLVDFGQRQPSRSPSIPVQVAIVIAVASTRHPTPPPSSAAPGPSALV